jgi:hypothetical protein
MTDGGPPDSAEVSNGLPISDGIRAALALLTRALECAQDAQANLWDFALEIGQLYAAGLTITDLRWMVVKEFVEHAAETSVHGDEHRSFTPSRGLTFLPTTCVVLTKKGAALAARANRPASHENPGANGKSPPLASLKPHWDAARRELALGDRMVKGSTCRREIRNWFCAPFKKPIGPSSSTIRLPTSSISIQRLA